MWFASLAAVAAFVPFVAHPVDASSDNRFEVATLGGAAFRVQQVPNPDFYYGNRRGPIALARAYSKFGAPIPDDLRSLVDNILDELGLLKGHKGKHRGGRHKGGKGKGKGKKKGGKGGKNPENGGMKGNGTTTPPPGGNGGMDGGNGGMKGNGTTMSPGGNGGGSAGGGGMKGNGTTTSPGGGGMKGNGTMSGGTGGNKGNGTAATPKGESTYTPPSGLSSQSSR